MDEYSLTLNPRPPPGFIPRSGALHYRPGVLRVGHLAPRRFFYVAVRRRLGGCEVQMPRERLHHSHTRKFLDLPVLR